MILCSKLKNGLWKIITKSQVVNKSRLHYSTSLPYQNGCDNVEKILNYQNSSNVRNKIWFIFQTTPICTNMKMDIPLKLGTILRETHNFRRLLKPWNILFIQLVSAFTMILGNSVDLFWKKNLIWFTAGRFELKCITLNGLEFKIRRFKAQRNM